jgi:hypothetical protein
MAQSTKKEGKKMAKIIDITVAGRINALNDGERCYHFNGKEFKRGNSWEHCHNAFAKNNEERQGSSSWGLGMPNQLNGEKPLLSREHFCSYS